MKIRCFATPNDLLPGDLDGAAAIVIDTLRMTSVAAAAMSNGCAGLLACATVEAAREGQGEGARRASGRRTKRPEDRRL